MKQDNRESRARLSAGTPGYISPCDPLTSLSEIMTDNYFIKRITRYQRGKHCPTDHHQVSLRVHPRSQLSRLLHPLHPFACRSRIADTTKSEYRTAARYIPFSENAAKPVGLHSYSFPFFPLFIEPSPSPSLGEQSRSQSARRIGRVLSRSPRTRVCSHSSRARSKTPR